MLEGMRDKLQRRFNDLDLKREADNLIICSLGDIGSWRLKIKSHSIEYPVGIQIHEDLVLLADEFRREYFDVI